MRVPLSLTLLLAALAQVACSTAGSGAAAEDSGAMEDSSSVVDSGAAVDSTTAQDAAGVYLTALSVSTQAGNKPLDLVPAFSSFIHDYYVVCGAGSNALAVTMTASPSAESAVLQPTQSPSAPTQTFALKVNEGAAIVAAAVRGAATDSYWVRCLPHDFPKLQMTPHPDAGSPAPGYYLVGNMTGGPAGYAMVLDVNGVPVWFDRDGTSVANVDTLTPGVISFIDQHTGRSYENHRLSPLQTSFVTIAGAAADVHEMRALPNGNFLVLDSSTVPGVDLTGLTLPLQDGGVKSFGPNSIIRECVVDEVDPHGKVVWQWKASAHFDPVKDMTFLSPPEEYPGKEVVEPYHCNAIDVDTSGNLLVSARHMDSVFYIERATGKVLWKMGGATYCKDPATYVPVDDPFYREHDGRFQPDWTPTCAGKSGSGKISVFDDESSLPGPARGVVYHVNVGAPGCGDAGAPGATRVWQYKGTGPAAVPASATGSFRVLPGGGGIVGWGATPGLGFTEVDANGNALLDLTFPGQCTSYRAVKVPLTAFDLNVLRATAGQSGPAVVVDAGASEAGAQDSGVADVAAPPDAGAGCHTTSGSGASEQCTYASQAGACGVDAGAMAGSCSSTGLYGCCVETLPVDGGQALTATCYYTATTGQPAASQCAFLAYEGMPYDWQTNAP